MYKIIAAIALCLTIVACVGRSNRGARSTTADSNSSSSANSGDLSCLDICEAVGAGCHAGISESVADGTLDAEYGAAAQEGCSEAAADCRRDC